MNEQCAEAGIWFVYDGDCPLCRNAALAFRIRKEYAVLHLINARELEPAHPLMQKINQQGLDLDDGMVIYDGQRFYHGAGALRFMAVHGATSGVFNKVNKVFAWPALAALTYPWMRGIRNALLRRQGSARIDNLGLREAPTFKGIFGDEWDNLPCVIRKHYANRPYTQDRTMVTGTLDVMCAGPIRLLAPLFWLMGGIPPRNEKGVTVTVEFESDEHSRSFHFNRVFYFQGRRPYRFRSRMIQVRQNEVVEIMRGCVGWHMNVSWDGQRVQLKHKGYVLAAFGHFIPLPLTAIFGQGNAHEAALDEHSFDMRVEIRHPWWGKIYGYQGRFEVTQGT